MMDSNEKKSKRPRIGEIRNAATEGEHPAYTSDNTADHATRPFNGDNQGAYRERQYTSGPRQYTNNRQGGYNRYNNDRDGYRPRPRFDNEPSDNAAVTSAASEGSDAVQENTGYRPNNQGYRRYDNNQGYNRQGGYNNRQGGYNNNRYNNDRQGGYGNNRRYDNNSEGGSYGNNRQGGYNNRQGGYNNNRYNNDRQGGYNNNRRYDNNSEGGSYGNNRQSGYNNRQGGYNNNNRQGGYNNRQGNRPGGRQQMRHNEFGMPHGGKSFVPRPKRVEYEAEIPDPNELIRLNKFMANAGICSRREADEFIQQGLVKVNGEVVTELGTKISHSDTVEYDEKVVALERKCYILLNKPKDCVTTSDDPNGRTTVMDLVKNACDERIYPVGRLDRNTTGVLLLTNDGDLASKLTHPKYVKKKIYHVWTDKDISEDDMQRIADGIELEDGPIHADAISYATETDRNQAGIEIHSGRNRIVRRIFESLGYHVTKLDRVYFAGLTKKNLPRGRWRYLTQEEVNFLKMGAFE